jgi:signal transduction histidine kinase
MEENLQEEQREYLNDIQSSGRRMWDMINMSLGVYQMEQGEYQLRPEAVDLLSIIRTIEKDLNTYLRSHQSSLEIDNLQEEHDSFIVSGERLLCYTMLSNLIKNAVEAVPAGEDVHIQLENYAENQARVCIQNKGFIPQRIQERFGERYATAGKKQGTGLGVYSARLIAETMQGSFNWSTSEESGTSVCVILPRPVDM